MLVKARDVIVCTYTSLSQGHQGSDPPNSPQWFYPLYNTLIAQYGTGAAPTIANTGVAGETISGIVTNFAGRIGTLNPNIVIIDGCPNDLGVTGATLDTLWAKLTGASNYGNGIKPRGVIWMSTNWRGDESSGGVNQAQIQTDNTLQASKVTANSASFTGGAQFANMWGAWNVDRLINNPTNLTSGVYTTDGTHQKTLGANLMSSTVAGLFTYG